MMATKAISEYVKGFNALIEDKFIKVSCDSEEYAASTKQIMVWYYLKISITAMKCQEFPVNNFVLMERVKLLSQWKKSLFFSLFSTFNFIIILKSYSSQKMKQNLFFKILDKL